MKKDKELLKQNYLTHKAKKAKQWDKKRKKAARLERKNKNQIELEPEENYSTGYGGSDPDNYCGGY